MNATPKQIRILAAIRDFQLQNGYCPTMQEIADRLDISKVTVFEHIEALVRKGLLERDRYRARSLQLSEGVKLPDENKPTRLPMVGTIAAGRPIEAVEESQSLDLETLFSSRHGVYVLRVSGSSMIEDHIADGDFVVIERRETAQDGEVVVALLEDGQATLKRLYHERNRIRLQPANSTMQPIYVDKDLRIQGVLIGVLRSLGRVGKFLVTDEPVVPAA